jgi:hypothetical protein
MGVIVFGNSLNSLPYLESGLELFFQCAALGLFAVVVMMLFRNIDSKSLLDNYKFEIKKAKDIS